MSQKISKINRSKNFTEREKSHLLTIVEKYKSIIECKKTNAVSVIKKNEVWDKVALEFNSSAEHPRTVKQLSTAYINLKRLTRQNVAANNIQNYLEHCKESTSSVAYEDENDENASSQIPQTNEDYLLELVKKYKKDEIADKKAIKATGGGSYKPVLTDVGAQMLALMGNQIKPLNNTCDSASKYYNHTIKPPQETAVVVESDTQDVLEDYSDINFNENLMGGPTNCEESVIIIDVQETDPDLKDSNTKKVTSASKNLLKNKTKATSNLSNPNSKKTNILKRKNNNCSETLRKQYYCKKIESANIEKRSKLLEFKLNVKRNQLIDLEIKIKKKELDKISL